MYVLKLNNEFDLLSRGPLSEALSSRQRRTCALWRC